ncbi:MAG: membrane integrity-associated transporter subunit PqiC [Verrucomicrobia bacterium]|nr:membrane integrity-associated transporter subunit PqiC [Verrucomicrobiota bacterium]MBV9674461.1 membrane integrity-associated transporter subunit PqiC [Verrucomicrobiota bacterium]
MPAFFVLTSASTGDVRWGRGTSVFIHPADLAPYLKPDSLAVRKGTNEIVYPRTALWAEPLDRGLPRAVADNLSRNHGFRAYAFAPGSPPPQVGYDIEIRLDRFEGDDNGDVILSCRWSVSDSESSVPITRRGIELRDSGWKPGDYPDLVARLSALVAKLSTQIARSVP